jgi:plastocyanin
VNEEGKVLKVRGYLGASLAAAAFAVMLSTGGAFAQTGPAVNINDGETIDAYAFDPSSMTLNVGDTLMWTNTGNMAHTVTAADGSFDSGMLQPGDTFGFTFSSPGTYSYACSPHPWMKATITVN